MRITKNGSKISKCGECPDRMNNAGPVGWICKLVNGQILPSMEGFPKFCPLEDVVEEKKEISDENRNGLIDKIGKLIEGGMENEQLVDAVKNLVLNNDLPPQPWCPGEVNGVEVLLDDNNEGIVMFLCDEEYRHNLIRLFEAAPKLLGVCEDLLEWIKQNGGDEWLKDLTEHAEEAIKIAKGENNEG